MTKIRLQKFLQAAGIASRRKSDDLVAEGVVRVNGVIVTQMGFLIDPTKDAIKVRGKRVLPQHQQPKMYLALYKPRGVVCTASDPTSRPTCFDLLPPALAHKKLTYVGRLDMQSEGLLLLSNDGDFVHRCTHPRFHVSKTYHVKARGQIPQPLLAKLASGIVIDGKRTLPCKVQTMSRKDAKHTWLSMEIHEGRNQILRKMLYAIGHGAVKIKRVAVGSVRLEDLRPGTFRMLTAKEVKELTQP